MLRSTRKIIKPKICWNDYSVFACREGVYLQLDYKEDLVDYIEDIDNYWAKRK